MGKMHLVLPFAHHWDPWRLLACCCVCPMVPYAHYCYSMGAGSQLAN